MRRIHRLALEPATIAALSAIGPKGQPSIDVFGLNDRTTSRKLPQARKETFLKLQLLLEAYERSLGEGDIEQANFVKQTVQDEPFPAVMGWLVAIAQSPAASALLRPGVEAIVKSRGVDQW